METKTEKVNNITNKLNECLLKIFDNIMQQQNKMDNKAYIFIGFIIFIFNSFLKKTGISFDSIVLFVISLPLVFSLLPITTTLGLKLIKLYKQNDTKHKHNFFYYTDICHLSNEEFVEILQKEYGVSNLTLADSKLIEQIIINAEILNAKVIGHSIFLWLVLIGIVSSLIYHKF